MAENTYDNMSRLSAKHALSKDPFSSKSQIDTKKYMDQNKDYVESEKEVARRLILEKLRKEPGMKDKESAIQQYNLTPLEHRKEVAKQIEAAKAETKNEKTSIAYIAAMKKGNRDRAALIKHQPTFFDEEGVKSQKWQKAIKKAQNV